MARLSGEQYASVLTAVRQVSGALTREEFATATLRAVPTLIDSDVTSLNEVDPFAGTLAFWSNPDDLDYPEAAVRAWIDLAQDHPLINYYAETGDGSARRISDLLTLEAWHDSPLYRRFYQVVGVEFQMSITLPAPMPIVIGLAVNRSSDDFTDDDRALLDLIRPHLAHAWRQVREHERLRVMLDSATGVLAASGAGAVAISDVVTELTTGALVDLYRFFGRPDVRDPLPARVRQWVDRQRAGDARNGARADMPLAEPLRATREDRRLVLRFLPHGLGGTDVILLNEAPASSDTKTLRAAGLTPRESETLDLLTTGVSIQQMAVELSLSPWTVKRHLASIYAKLGVSGRAGATAVALEIAAHHSDI